MADLKFCKICQQDKSLDEFYKNSKGRDGLDARCKLCRKAFSKEWVEKNPEKRKKIALDYFHRNTDHYQEYRETHKEQKAATDKKYYENNPGRAHEFRKKR